MQIAVSVYSDGDLTLEVVESVVCRLGQCPATVNSAARLIATQPSLPTDAWAMTSAPTAAPVALPR